ncbi:pirin family protein [Microbacterium sp. M3]|uniref:Pirin family protein n=1 Tax=Microbacterium arthrosphaerae TaxID=792652 RepID=A0ABU4H4V3_9MICO|nr:MULTISPECIES: pirin family protein [Microbacterium]MDW4574353.1 pirin family protein [Microbacterium arthrosphaerae]MDW7608208.1 pirin family protein [Microbacterium sp. M3]
MTRMDADAAVATESAVECIGPRALLLEVREVPLGGVRAMSVHRALPQRELPLVGAWCFLDRFGPQETRMRVEPHPHIGLQTVTWPYLGDVRHRDSVGSDVVVQRGALNLMTSGAGISHSEYSVGDDAAPLDALQLWVALPESRRHGAPAFEQHAVLPEFELVAVDGAPGAATVVLGELGGVRSPATVYTPIIGAELRIAAGSTVRVPLDPAWEHALVAVQGEASAESVTLDTAHLLYLGTRRKGVEITSPTGATLFLLGGEPFEDDVVMWWNFVGRTHEEIVDAREAWESGSERFGRVVDHGDERIPAPPMPAVRLTRRRRRL